MEFMMIFAFSLVIILPMIALLRSEYMDSKQSLDEGQAKKVLDDLTLAATEVYYSGYPSRTTLDVYFPAGVFNITNSTGNGKSELIFKVGPNKEQTKELITVFNFNIEIDPSMLPPRDGKKKILVESALDGGGNTYIIFSVP